MDNYKYFNNAKKNGYFTDTHCQFCGSNEHCLDGVFFQRSDDLESICLSCFDKKEISVVIPDYVAYKVKENRDEKVNTLSFCPPVPWIQNNEWPVCCDDFMEYIGEWEQKEFTEYSENSDGISLPKEFLIDELKEKVANYDCLWEDLGYGTAAFVFKCSQCGKIKVICQDY